MADYPGSGALSYIQYGWEAAATYGTVSATLDKAFGHNQRITVKRSMNTNRVYGLGNIDASAAYSGLFEGALTIEFDMASTYFMKLIMGEGANAGGGAAAYTHTYTDLAGYKVVSFSVENGINLDTDSVFTYLGCVVDRCTIEGRVGETVHVTLECKYANETWVSSGLDSTPAADAEDVMVFSEGALEIPNATAIARVQSFRLEIVRNAELIYGLGSRIASTAVWKTREWNWSLSCTYENEDLVQDMYGQTTGPLTATNPAGEASLELTFTNSGATTAERSLVILLTTSYITSDNFPQNVGDLMVNEYTGFSNDVTSVVGTDYTTVTWTNG